MTNTKTTPASLLPCREAFEKWYKAYQADWAKFQDEAVDSGWTWDAWQAAWNTRTPDKLPTELIARASEWLEMGIDIGQNGFNARDLITEMRDYIVNGRVYGT